MYQIFENTQQGATGLYHFPEFDYIRRTYLQELSTIEDYYHARVYAVKSNHFLQYLLDDLSVPMQYEPRRYVEACRARANFVSKTIGMTCDTGFGKIHQGTFYGPGSQEIIFNVDEWFDIDEVLGNWQNIIAVKPLWHDRSDLNLMLPNGKKSGTESGLSAISINVAMLSLQYRQFSLDQMTRMGQKNGLLGTSHFIHMYVLPNMMGPHIDIVIFNRLMNLFYGKPMGIGLMRHAFPLSDYSSKVDHVLRKVLARLETIRADEVEMINFIPSIFSRTMIQALQMPDIATTKQAWWALLLTRIQIMKFLIDIGAISGSNLMNTQDINILKKDLYRLKRENVLQTVLPYDMYFDFNSTIDEILAI